MKVTLCLLFVMSILLIGGCAANGKKEEAYQAYVACVNESKVPKTDSRGVVALDKERNPIMIYKKGACSAENDAYNILAAKSDNRIDRRARPSCPGQLIAYCEGRCNARDLANERCRCQCITPGQMREALRGFSRY